MLRTLIGARRSPHRAADYLYWIRCAGLDVLKQTCFGEEEFPRADQRAQSPAELPMCKPSLYESDRRRAFE